MGMNAFGKRDFTGQEKGVTLIELLTVVSILLIISVISIPSFAQVRKNLECRRTARNILQLLREARSTAIAMNRECRVEFEPLARRFGLRKGDKSADTNWSVIPPVSDWIDIPNDVNLTANVKSIQFNTNGTANGGTVTIRDSYDNKKFDVVVARTGRIRIK